MLFLSDTYDKSTTIFNLQMQLILAKIVDVRAICPTDTLLSAASLIDVRKVIGSSPISSTIDSHLRVAVLFCQATDRLQWVRS